MVQTIRDKGKALTELKQKLAAVDGEVERQNRHKKMLQDNINVIESRLEADALLVEVQELEKEVQAIEGSDTAYAEHRAALDIKRKKHSELARLEGRWMEVVEAIRGLKRKLSTEEYKNVEEEHRRANIKYHTTQLAAEDVKRYWTAVDKALLKYHSVKIAVCASCLILHFLCVYCAPNRIHFSLVYPRKSTRWVQLIFGDLT